MPGWGVVRVARIVALVALAAAGRTAFGAPALADELLFLSNRANNVYEHYRMTPATGRVSRVLTERGETSLMSWSPDGTRVLYTARRGGRFDNVFVTELVTGRTTQLTREEQQPVTEPSWSPDGRRITFVSSRLGPRRVFVMNADGSDARAVTGWAAVEEISPRFSPDGKRIAFLGTSQSDRMPRLSVVELSNGKVVTLSRAATRGTETPPVWSPDGKTVLTSATRSQQAHIVVHPADGAVPSDLTRDDARHTDPHWSPDGRKILYLAIPGNSARQGVYVMNADGSEPRKLYGGAHDVMNARWSFDGTRVFFVEHLDAGGKIFTIDAAGGSPRRLSGDEGFDIDVQPCCRLRPPRFAGTN